ncbi:MAG: hypothetical protein GIS02_00455 [Methanosarcinales archaeon]|uniref:Uncharacterized protein n=1 Tax=Candidatus Ethanoperedens thermophilum TaxID=2766897 RepID=A0A848D879_9EURY|nr:hypothetical protein [Candidatus Ethanoperedens thermophilum]
MESKTLYIGLAVVAIGLLVVGIAIFTSGDDLLERPEVMSDQEQATNESDVIDETLREDHDDGATPVTPSVNWDEWDEVLRKYEKSDLPFNRDESDDTVIYWHQREIDGAIVEFDYINYQFDKDTKELKKKIIHWRDDLPEHLPPIITKEEAESIVGGEVQFSKLYIISPKSHVVQIKPTPENPCWVVRSIDKNGNIIITIIDAVEGKMLGYGVPPPFTGFSLSGPMNTTNCSGVWTDHYQNAESWFNTMGYPTDAVVYPNEVKVKSHIQSHETAMFYELAHGGSDYFENDCIGAITANEIGSWIEDYPKMPFTFVGSCGGMCEIDTGTFSYEFRKGSIESTVGIKADMLRNMW